MTKQALVVLLLLFSLISPCLYSQDTSTVVKTNTIDPRFQDSVNLVLLIAAESGELEKVLNAINSGADVNCRSYQGVTALMYAAQGNNTEIIKVLLYNGADPNMRPRNGETALISTAIFNNIDAADLLIQNGANIDAADNYTANPLLYASAYGYDIMTDMLLYYEADIDIRTDDSTNAIIIASLNGKTSIVDSLIKRGADVNSSDKNGFTPLIVAAQNGHYDVIKILVENNSDVNVETSYGTTPLYYAANNGYTDIVDFLIQNGADVNQKILNDKSLNTIPNIYNYPIIRKTLKQNNLKLNYWPGFNSYIIGYGFSFNNKDFLSGAFVGLIDYKFNIGLSLGYEMRYYAKRIMVEKSPELYYQFWEKRTSIYATLSKRFKIISGLKSETGFVVGGKVLYTFGSYKGTSQHPDSKFMFSPQAGFYYSYDFIALKLIYEYIDYEIFDVSPHRINLGLMFKIDFIKYSKFEKKVEWLY